jgi:putative Holliday junction resolvase
VSRVLGVDLGTRRIGLACSDPLGVTATPLAVLERSGDPAADHQAIVAAAREAEATRIVVGLPRSLSGKLGPAARATRAEVEELRAVAGPDLAVETYDERFTSVIAQRSLVAADVRRRDRKQVVDKVAAAVMLQGYLESQVEHPT